MEIKWEQIENANKLIKTLPIKRKEKNEKGEWIEKTNEYAEVKERVIAFRRVYPHGTIETIQKTTENYIEYKAIVKDGDVVLADGDAREYAKNQYALEKAQTSAIGRALGFCGFGVNTSISSAEDIERLTDGKIFDETPKKDLVEQFTSLYSNIEQVNILNGLQETDPYDVDSEILLKYINIKKYGKK